MKVQNTNPKTNNKALIVVISVIVGLFIISVIIGGILIFVVGKKVSDKSTEFTKEATEFAASVNNYPTAYISAGLPQYPDVQITNLSGDDAAPQNGIVVYFTTTDQAGNVTDYFDSQMQKLGWQLDDSSNNSQGSNNISSRNYKKDGQELTVNAIQTDDTTNVTISWKVN